MNYKNIEDTIGNTPLIQLKRLPGMVAQENRNIVLAKLEGNSPAGSVKDRAAMSMIKRAEAQGVLKAGDTLIEATSGNTGIALAMTAAMRGYKMILVMPENLSVERRQCMAAYGAEIILTPKARGMEFARDVAENMQKQGKGVILNQFANLANPDAHYESTGPEIWRDTGGLITHFVSAMGTTGTIMGVSRYLKEKKEKTQVIGVQPEEGSQIAGIRKWSDIYVPSFYDRRRIDRIAYIGQADAENTARQMAQIEGIFCGVSSGAACHIALEISRSVENAMIVFVVCDRGDRYLSTGVFPI